MRPPGPTPGRRAAGACRSSSRRAAACAVGLLAVLASAATAAAAPAPDLLDRGFGRSGRVVVDLGGDDAVDAMALDGRGRVVVAGRTRAADRAQLVLTAVAPDGTLDASFGERGTARVDAGRGAHVAALAATAEGIVAVGWTGDADDADVAPLALRASPDGTFDADFAARARQALREPGEVRVLAVAGAGEGRILVGGATRDDGAERAFVVRLLPDGRRDPSFGDAGRVMRAGAMREAAVLALASDAHGRVAVAGRAGGGAFVARLAADGAPDRGFAHDGTALVPLEHAARVVAAVFAPDGGAIFVAPARRGAVPAPSLVARTRPDGTLDEAFGTAAVSALGVAGGVLQAHGIAPDPAGAVVVGGTVSTGGGEHALLVRLAALGARDASFGASGVVDATSATRADVAAVVVQADGRVVVAGALGTGAARDIVVARFAAGEARCGDGALAPGEQCDDGAANGAAGSCCSTSCTPRPAGSACRAAAGACDEAELCDGRSAVCPEDVFTRAGAACRAAAGACDVAEVCSGTSPACPADDVRRRGTVCRVASGACDLDEECDGIAGECPADAKRTGECRASRGGCDPAEWCDGSSGDCPADAQLRDGAACDDGDACTADDVCVANVCRGGPRDDFACTGWLCSRMRAKERVSGAPPRAADMRALGLDVQVDGARAVCVPAVTTGDDAHAGASTPRGDDADVQAADAHDDRVAYVAYRVTPVARRRAQEPAPRLVAATIEDRFGVLDLTPRQVRLVSLPAAVGAPEAGGAPGGAAYQCQQIGPGEAAAPAAREVAVRALGEATSERFTLGRPLRVCHPLAAGDDDGADGADPDDVLVCYELRRGGAEAATPRSPLLAVTAFESLLVAGLGERQLCVPAVLVGAAWDEPAPRRKQRRDPETRRPHRQRDPDRAPRPHRRERPPRAVEAPSGP